MSNQPNLVAAVTEAYRVFPDTGLGGALYVCTCGVCMPVEVKAAIEKTPREKLSSEQIGEYLNSAHEPGDPLAVHQMRWLLPRLLECCAVGPWPYSMTEYTFSKLKGAGFPAWPETEKAVIRNVFLGLFAAALVAAQWNDGDHPEHLLEAFVRAGEPVGPYIELWAGDRSEQATVALAELVTWRLSYAKGTAELRLRDSWASKADSDLFLAWLQGPETVARFSDAFFAASDPAVAELLSMAHQVLEPRG